MNSPPPVLGAYAQLVFFFILFIPVALVILRLAMKKGRPGWYALFGFIPLANFLVAVWLAGLPDLDLLQRIKALESRL